MSSLQVCRPGALCDLSTSLQASGPGGRHDVSWPLVLGSQVAGRGVDLTLPLQNMDGSASLPLRLSSALTHTWATSSRPREE